MIDLSPPAPGTIVKPDTTPARADKPTDLAKHKLSGGAAPANARRARVATDKLLSDPDFDWSLTATRARLEKSAAVMSAIALQRAENGLVSEDDPDLLQKAAVLYRTLATTEPGDPTAQRPGESVEDYRSRLEAMAGGK